MHRIKINLKNALHTITEETMMNKSLSIDENNLTKWIFMHFTITVRVSLMLVDFTVHEICSLN